MIMKFLKLNCKSAFLLLSSIFYFDDALFAQIAPNASGVVFVNKNVTGGDQSGNSWINAVPELADALLSAHSNSSIQQIWVAQGTYAPKYSAGTDGIDPWLQFGSPTSGPAASFVLVNNVKLYGGFQNATETSTEQRDTVNNNTILTGDSLFRHVVMSVGPVGSAELNGFTISKGLAAPVQTFYVNSMYTRSSFGAGLYMDNTSLAVNNCIITNNRGECGAGIYANNSSLVLRHSSVTGNHAIGGDGVNAQSSSAARGGGIYFKDGSALTIDHSNISDNAATATKGYVMGGGLNITQTNFAPVNITSSNFRNNEVKLNVPAGTTHPVAYAMGGGLYIHNPGQLSYIDNCVFSDNLVQLSSQNALLPTTSINHVIGGGIYNRSPLVIDRSTIKNNQLIANIDPANDPGGMTAGAGIGTDGSSNGLVGGINTGVNTTINNCIIENNETSGNFKPAGGGLAYIMEMHLLATAIKPKINNTIIRNNSAPSGGGMYCFTLAPIVKNSLFSGNVATEGTAIYNTSEGQSAQPQLINCTVADNKAASNEATIISNNNTSTTTISNSILYDNMGTLSTTSNTATYSIIEGTTLFPGSGNKNQDPQFTSTTVGNFGLLNTSPAANAGNNAAYSAVGNISNDTDLAGHSRLFESTIDMGAFELQRPAVDTSTSIRPAKDRMVTIRSYPNPVHAGGQVKLYIDLPATDMKGAELRLTDALGRTVATQEIPGGEQQITAPEVPGLYFITITLISGVQAKATISIF